MNLYRALHSLSLQASQAKDLDELYRIIVSMGQSEMGFSRVGLLLYDPQKQEMVGTYGTDPQGRLRNEHEYRQIIKPESTFIWQSLAERNFVSIRKDTILWDEGKEVGKGWVAIVGLWNRERAFGWIAVDNLLNETEIDEDMETRIAAFGAAASNLIVTKSYEQDLVSQLDERNQVLAEQLEELKATRNQLEVSERLAGLGRMVSGIVHEVNNPLSNAVLGVSHGLSLIQTIISSCNNSSLQATLSDLQEVMDVAFGNLQSAGYLLERFKQMSSDQSSEKFEHGVGIGQLVENLFASHVHLVKKSGIHLVNEVDQGLMVSTYPGLLTQVLANLIQNSIRHGFSGLEMADRDPTIVIKASSTLDKWKLVYTDNGRGIAADRREKIFEPFYTTARERGGSGLGLSIAQSIVVRKLEGQIFLEKPQPVHGASFVLSFPLKSRE